MLLAELLPGDYWPSLSLGGDWPSCSSRRRSHLQSYCWSKLALLELQEDQHSSLKLKEELITTVRGELVVLEIQEEY